MVNCSTRDQFLTERKKQKTLCVCKVVEHENIERENIEHWFYQLALQHSTNPVVRCHVNASTITTTSVAQPPPRLN